MTDLAAAIVTLRPTTSFNVPHWTGHEFRLWFLSLVQRYDPDLATEQQKEDRPRAYTISSLLGLPRFRRDQPVVRPEYTYAVRLTTLQPPLTDLFLEKILPTISGNEIAFENGRFSIEYVTISGDHHALTGTSTIEEILREKTLSTDPLPKQIGLRFESPTSFKSKGLLIPFPLPDLVFGSLIDRWNALNAVKLHPETRRFAAECIAVNRHRIETIYTTCKTDIGYNNVIGFWGFCRYTVVNRDRYWMGLIHTLATYGFYAGVGIRTTTGLGRILPMFSEVPHNQVPASG
jgi:CRISPR-associated endoribonuclease Cas6